jgi:hypothetical protein
MPQRHMSTIPELDVQHIHCLLMGLRSWYFISDPPVFADDASALACYARLRPLLLPWCQQHLRGGVPWAESLYTGQLVPAITHLNGYSLESCRQFLAVYYGQHGS